MEVGSSQPTALLPLDWISLCVTFTVPYHLPPTKRRGHIAQKQEGGIPFLSSQAEMSANLRLLAAFMPPLIHFLLSLFILLHVTGADIISCSAC